MIRFLITTHSSAQSPNQTSGFNGESRVEERNGWLDVDQMRLFTERLQPQQWLGPASMGWVSNPSIP
jgi:hypothetical protein